MGHKADDWWVPEIGQSGKPLYLEIADAIAEDRRSGRLKGLERLPPQRWLAQRLGLNFSTISRAYVEAQRRGLIDSHVGQGSFVRPPGPDASAGLPPPGDLSMNLPPEPSDPALLDRMRQSFVQLGWNADPRALIRYGDFAGRIDDRKAAAQWLRPRLHQIEPADILITAGAQGALLAILTVLAQPGEAVCCDELTYPGLRALASHLGLRLIGLPSDEEGPDPSSLAYACRDIGPKAIYLNPTLHNPTTRTISARRRLQLAEIARSHHVPIVEDDAYGALPDDAPPPFAALAPDITFHISGLAKCLGGGLRLAYVTAPSGNWLSRLTASARATTLTASAIPAALVSQWIVEGLAAEIVSAVRAESEARQTLAAGILPKGGYWAHPQGFHLWLPLPRPWSRGEFLTSLRSKGIGVMGSDAFNASAANIPEAVRLCLGGSISRDTLGATLMSIATTLSQPPGMMPAVI
ncbi:MAG TPA: PLP-dependent aminotransferase family protein [Candidatus Sulfotelmatobacter sp.]|jgi:DNA-binding transcriptional MocR family regulator|nr:PLP-dependent aminotransferase family protein [Candidatus Sulfotelmatobacter sp.]